MYACIFVSSLSPSSLCSLLSLPDHKVFLATWKEIPPSNEVQGSVDNVLLTAGIMLDELETVLTVA